MLKMFRCNGCPNYLSVFVLLCVFFVNHGATHSSGGGSSYPITTLINAKWTQTPLYLEIAEYIADENSDLFWDYATGIAQLDTPLADIKTESKQYISAIDVVRSRISALQVPLLKLVVAMHSLTPRIQTHFQIAANALGSGNCQSPIFVQIGNELACSLNELRNKLHQEDAALDASVDTYSFDHIYPGSENNTRTVVVYGDIGTKEFANMHAYLLEMALGGKVRYLLRHYMAKTTIPQRPVRLSGYGVELHLKSQEYKSQDDAPKPTDENKSDAENAPGEMDVHGFDFTILKARFPTLVHSLEQLRHSLLQGNEEIAQLKAWEFQDLGLQATAAIAEIQGEEALKILQFTAQNFPMQARSLLGHKVSEPLRDEVKHNIEAFGRSLHIVPPDGALFINGIFFDVDSMDLAAVVETLRSEVRLLESLHANKVRGNLASALLALDLGSTNQRDFAIDIRDSAILWVNDIESDAQYRRWPASVMDLLRPTFPGMLRNIRKNVFNLVLVVDPLQAQGRSLIKLAESFLLHQAPVRLGFVFDHRAATAADADDDFHALLCAYNYITQKKDSRAALGFLTDIFSGLEGEERVRRQHIRAQMRKTFSSLSVSAIDDVIGNDSDYDYGRQLAAEFVERLGYDSTPQALLNGVPMQQSLLASDTDFEEAVFSDIIQQTSDLQKAVYRGELTDAENNILDYLMNQAHVMPRLNQRILSTEQTNYVDLTGVAHTDLSNVAALAQLSNRDMTATLLRNLKYFRSKHSMEHIGGTSINFLTLWIFGDLETPTGRELLLNALRYQKTGGSVRVAFIPNAEGVSVARRDNLNRLVWAAVHSLPESQATETVFKWLQTPPGEKLQLPVELNDLIPSTELHVKMLRVYAQRVHQLRTGERLVVANGKSYSPLKPKEQFSVEDFGLIERFNALQYGDKIRKVLQQQHSAGNDDTDVARIDSDTLLQLFANLVPRQSKTRFKMPADVKEEVSAVKLAPHDDQLPHFDIHAVVDPASRSAQKLAPVLMLLRNTLNCRMRIYLTPVAQHSDMPVKNFYRYVVEPTVQFQPNGEMAEGPAAKFTGLPANPLYTQQLQLPENWLVEAVHAVYDLDNIRLNEIGGPVHSEFELEYLLLEGHCFDAGSGAPPRGLQITLGSAQQPALVDTIVMANLGYFQLKANPGVWQLLLREGKSADIYDIISADGPNTVHSNHTTSIVISSLRSHVIKLRVSKKDGYQNADLLADDDDQVQTGIWNSITTSFGGASPSATASEDGETINIFSVASGHLYERLLRIMMVSLLKHTKSPVKFWFLKNYLSPQFTDFLPFMAREYGFKYELVQYKWPRWLHQQTEKQRTIWGYKILFLDVLFPLNVRKIIFVDADAIVRADLKELYDLDLGGAPYAYTPFCDSRKEMDGFRFWKQGYWRSHLMGRRYHISALYVVDLRRFRRIAAGDRLRGQYQALSQDPNSLSNLDQDLPNNMVHQVAIKSLPDDWLWCQTWCNDVSLKSAKVIDLCNNPMTKEAKLTAAQRIVPEWTDYDQELKALMAKIEDHENSDHESHQQQIDEYAGKTIMEDASADGEHSFKHGEL